MFAVMPSTAATAAATESLHSSSRRSRMRSSSKPDLYCSFCQRRFNKSYNLMIHERSHLSEASQIYYCDVCGKSFKQRDILKQHRSQHSPGGSSSGSSSGYSPTNPFF